MAPRISRVKKAVVAAAAIVVAIGGAGAAYAYWTAQGSGIGGAQTGATAPFEIVSIAPVGSLAPGSAGQTVGFTVKNPSTASQLLGAVTVRMGTSNGTTFTPWAPTGGCLIADYTASVTTQPTQGELAPGATALGGVATVVLRNTAVSQDACQGQAVPLYFDTSTIPPVIPPALP